MPGLFLYADAGFDSAQFRRVCYEQGVFPNVAFNKCRREKNGGRVFHMNGFAKKSYNIEITNVRMDSYRSTLNRLDTTQTSWEV